MMQQATIPSILAVFVGGGFGCVARYLVGCFASKYGKYVFPYHTLFVNIVSCFIMGFVFAFFATKSTLPSNLKILLMVGFCGGLSTFSALSLEVINMINNHNYYIMSLYVILSVVLCVVAVAIGILAGGSVARSV